MGQNAIVSQECSLPPCLLFCSRRDDEVQGKGGIRMNALETMNLELRTYSLIYYSICMYVRTWMQREERGVKGLKLLPLDLYLESGWYLLAIYI